MTDREKAIVMAYTGVTMLSGEKFSIFHEYIEKILGRPVWTHELAIELVWNEIKEKSKDDFLEICKTEDKTEERPHGEWINPSENPEFSNKDFFNDCSLCGHTQMDKSNFCPKCGADMRGDRE